MLQGAYSKSGYLVVTGMGFECQWHWLTCLTVSVCSSSPMHWSSWCHPSLTQVRPHNFFGASCLSGLDRLCHPWLGGLLVLHLVVHHLSLDQNFLPAPDRWSHKSRTYSAFEFKEVSLLKFLEMVGTIWLVFGSCQRSSLSPAALYPGLQHDRGRIAEAFVQRTHLTLAPPPVGPTLGSVRISIGTWHQYPHR